MRVELGSIVWLSSFVILPAFDGHPTERVIYAAGVNNDEALLLSLTVWVSEAALQLGLHESHTYDWRRKQQRKSETSQVEVDQAAEIARLKRQVAEQAEEMTD